MENKYIVVLDENGLSIYKDDFGNLILKDVNYQEYSLKDGYNINRIDYSKLSLYLNSLVETNDNHFYYYCNVLNVPVVDGNIDPNTIPVRFDVIFSQGCDTSMYPVSEERYLGISEYGFGITSINPYRGPLFLDADIPLSTYAVTPNIPFVDNNNQEFNSAAVSNHRFVTPITFNTSPSKAALEWDKYVKENPEEN